MLGAIPATTAVALAIVRAHLVQQVVPVVEDTVAQKTQLHTSVEHLKNAGAASVQVVMTQVLQA